MKPWVSARLVSLQFSFSNPAVIPPSVKHQPQEREEARNERKSRATGKLIIEPTEDVSLKWFIRELEGAGYEMIDAFYQERINPKGQPYGKATFHMVRFVFAPKEHVNLSEEFRQIQEVLRAELTDICQKAIWRVRAFANPFYQNGEEIPGQFAWSINFESRKPLFRPDGKPVTIWQKDEDGKRVGESPQPLKPKFWLMLWPDLHPCVTDPDDPD